MCITSTTATFITAGTGLAGVLIGSLIARWNGIHFIKRQEFNKAAATFYAAFLDDIYLVRNTDTKQISVALLERASKERRLQRESIDKVHEKAKIMFEPFIAKSDLPDFNAAWSAYYNWPEHYGMSKSKGKEYDFETHLNNLLMYAKPK